jgi:hypothetical protein
VEFYRFPHEKLHEVQKVSQWKILKQPPSISWYNKERLQLSIIGNLEEEYNVKGV